MSKHGDIAGPASVPQVRTSESEDALGSSDVLGPDGSTGGGPSLPGSVRDGRKQKASGSDQEQLLGAAGDVEGAHPPAAKSSSVVSESAANGPDLKDLLHLHNGGTPFSTTYGRPDPTEALAGMSGLNSLDSTGSRFDPKEAAVGRAYFKEAPSFDTGGLQVLAQNKSTDDVAQNKSTDDVLH